jgi:hypothetical protein
MEKRVRTGSFFSITGSEQNQKQLKKIEITDGKSAGSIKEMAMFSRIVNYQE